MKEQHHSGQKDQSAQQGTQEQQRQAEISRRSEEIKQEQLDTRPGKEHKMDTKPMFDDDFSGMNRLAGKVALITGGDSGIGRAVAVAFAKEGCKVAIVYRDETQDAQKTRDYIKDRGGQALIISGDAGDPAFCEQAVQKTVDAFGSLHILVNNAAEQHPQKEITDITPEQLQRTFKTNIFAQFYMVQAALSHLPEGASIINTASVTAYQGNKTLLDYSSTKGAITSFTRSLALNLAPKKIRVNQVAPGPIWTPLIPSTFGPEHVDRFGEDTPMKRAGQPVELAEAYIFFAWDRASSYVTGQTLHINGGDYVTS